MAGGQWDASTLPTRPGLYINFVSAAAAHINGGVLGTVAIPIFEYVGSTLPLPQQPTVEKTLYTVDNEYDAMIQFGEANIASIRFALQAGAKEVLVYTMPESPTSTDYAAMRAAFDTRAFNVFVFDGAVAATEQDAVKAWVASNRSEGKHFMAVFGAANAEDDLTPATGNTRSTRLSDDYCVNLINGVVIDGVSYSSAQYAPYIAGLIAGTTISNSITYKAVPVSDVTKRLTNGETKTALAAGSLVLTNDGEKVKVEQGWTTGKKKIRAMRARQAVSTDITKTAADAYIGRINNNADGQAALIAAIKAYLETLENSSVLTGPSVSLDPHYPSVGDSVFLTISYVEVDSMERIFLTINV